MFKTLIFTLLHKILGSTELIYMVWCQKEMAVGEPRLRIPKAAGTHTHAAGADSVASKLQRGTGGFLGWDNGGLG